MVTDPEAGELAEDLIAYLAAAINGDRRLFVAAKVDRRFDTVRPLVDSFLEQVAQEARISAESEANSAKSAIAIAREWECGKDAHAKDDFNLALNYLAKAHEKLATQSYFGYLDTIPLAKEAKQKAQAAYEKRKENPHLVIPSALNRLKEFLSEVNAQIERSREKPIPKKEKRSFLSRIFDNATPKDKFDQLLNTLADDNDYIACRQGLARLESEFAKKSLAERDFSETTIAEGILKEGVNSALRLTKHFFDRYEIVFPANTLEQHDDLREWWDWERDILTFWQYELEGKGSGQFEIKGKLEKEAERLIASENLHTRLMIVTRRQMAESAAKAGVEIDKQLRSIDEDEDGIKKRIRKGEDTKLQERLAGMLVGFLRRY